MIETENIIKEMLLSFPKGFKPQIAIVLGTRLSDFTKYMTDVFYVDFSDIKGFPTATGYGHKGRFALGYVFGVPIIVSDGRLHYYEGYSMKEVVLGIRLMQALGAEILIETNISGIINRSFNVGDIMLIKDHISSFVPSPLIGLSPTVRSERFVDMGKAYDDELNEIILSCAKKLNIPLREGTYVQVAGPNYETPAEIRMFGVLGADAIGMSTACEVIVAKQLGMRVCGISYLSNLAGVNISKTERESNLEIGKNKSTEIFEILNGTICAIKNTIL